MINLFSFKNFCKRSFFYLVTAVCFLSHQGFAFEKETVKIKESTIKWLGSKITGSHEGLVNLNSGFLIFDKNTFVGGEFVIDMASIVCTDLTGKGKASIEGHLMSDDFFSVDNYPTANLKIIDVEKKKNDTYLVNAYITIKNITQKIKFETKIEKNRALAKLVVDRTEFGIIYKSGNFFEEIADKAIYDEFEMTIELVF